MYILDSVDVRTKALLLGKSMHYANSWLFATPNTYSNSIINPKAFQLLLKYHSAMPICVHDQRCLACGKKMDAMGDHMISCNVTGQRIGKHNSLVRQVGSYLEKGKMTHRTEVGVEKDRMGDLVILDFANGRDLYVDLSVVSTLCASYRNMSSKEAGAAGFARRNEKLRKYAEQVEKVAFEPLVVESIGGWNIEGKKLLKKIAARVALENFLEEKTLLRDMMTLFSICLQKINAQMMLERICIF